jgi:amino-acid N-acetyltransferase
MLRKARIKDIKGIQALVNSFAKEDLMLPRSLNELYENLRDYWVYEERKKICGCAALHVCWDTLAEIKSVAVASSEQKKGVGTRLVEACIREAREMGAKQLFVLTYKPAFFKKFGFKKVSHSALPHKIWAECINCPKFPDCDEIALVRRV